MGVLATFLTMVSLAAPGQDRCSTACVVRVQRRVVAQRKRRVVAPYRAWLNRLAWCESTGRWHANTGNGFYGGLQFTLGSWRAVGGKGMPHHATRTEQMYRGVRLLKVQGPGAWPGCRYRA